MSYNIETTPHFEKELKDLAKRYKSMKQDFGKFKRVITYTTLVDENTGEVWLIEIYDKSEFSTIKTDVIKKMLKELGL